MINQLVEAVKGSMKFEKTTMTKIAEMRSAVRTIKSPKDARNANALMSSFLSNLYAVMEKYPELKSVEQVKSLMGSIKDVETEIARLRYTYNNIVQTFNTMREKIPSNIIALICGFKKLDYLEFEDEEEIKERPHIDL
jgi:LemA protein